MQGGLLRTDSMAGKGAGIGSYPSPAPTVNQRVLLRVATSSHTATVRISPLTIICQ